MRHEVPQFIDIEDKIFGPLTFKQAIYLTGSVGAAFAIYFLLENFIPFNIPMVLKVAVASPPIALGIALAFVKINKRPFINYVESAFYYSFSTRRYIWKKKNKKVSSEKKILSDDIITTVDKQYVPVISRSKIKNLAWSLDMEEDK